MKQLLLKPAVSGRIAELYSQMETAYGQIAARLHFSCQGCPDNCCDSYFQHHTYIEWAYLWEGLAALSGQEREIILERARTCVSESEKTLAKGKRPNQMCPLNQEGLCVLYSHRLMICRLHGVPAALTRPDGRKLSFPGCFRCQELISQMEGADPGNISLDRTELFRRLVDLEVALVGHKRHMLPKVKLTLAQMLVLGPPKLP